MIEKVFVILFLANILTVFILNGLVDIYKPYPHEWYDANSLGKLLSDFQGDLKGITSNTSSIMDPTFIFGTIQAIVNFIGKVVSGYYTAQLISLLGNFTILQYFYYIIYYLSMFLFVLKVASRFSWD